MVSQILDTDSTKGRRVGGEQKAYTTTTRFSRTVKEYEYEMGIISQATTFGLKSGLQHNQVIR